MEEHMPSTLDPSPQGFALNQFLDEDYLELSMNDLPMNDPKVNELLLTDSPIPELPIFQNHASWAASGLAYRSREPSILVPEPPRYPSIEEWDRIRPIVTKLYSKENRTLKKVKSMLERDHGFVATYRAHRQSLLTHADDYSTIGSACTRSESTSGIFARI
jgi:Clr5 domain